MAHSNIMHIMPRLEGNDGDSPEVQAYVDLVKKKAGRHNGEDYVVQTAEGEQIVETHVIRRGLPLRRRIEWAATVIRDREPLAVPETDSTQDETFPFTRISWTPNTGGETGFSRVTGVASRRRGSIDRPSEPSSTGLGDTADRLLSRVEERMIGVGIPSPDEITEHMGLLRQVSKQDRIIYSSPYPNREGRTRREVKAARKASPGK